MQVALAFPALTSLSPASILLRRFFEDGFNRQSSCCSWGENLPDSWTSKARFQLGKWTFSSLVSSISLLRRLEPEQIEVDGISLSALRARDGIPYVLLHGFGDSKESLLLLAAALPREFAPILIDLPGHGESAVAPVENLSILSLRDLVLKALLKMGLKRFHLLGHSLGAILSAFIAQKRPELVESMVMLNPGGPSGLGRDVQEALDRGENPMIPKTEEEFTDFLDFATHRKLPMPGFFRKYMAHRWTRRMDVLEQYFHALFVQNTDEQIPDEMKVLHCPGMLIVGMQDRLIHVEDRRFYQRYMPDLELVTFPDLGHASHIENVPHLLFKLHSFLRRHS
jgi:pimeloyl-ACP methyl ester carboxylesterase